MVGVNIISVLLFTVTTAQIVSGLADCLAYTDGFNSQYPLQSCKWFCCGTCTNRYCCSQESLSISEGSQWDCAQTYGAMDSVYVGSSIAGVIILVSVFILCCVCPCCCLYKICRKPQPVRATHTTTTVINTPYPQQPSALPPQAPQSYQYAGYQPVPIQPGYGPPVNPQQYHGPPAGPQQYQGPPALQTPYPAQPYMPGPPPPYHEAAAASYPPAPMAYSQAAFSPGQQPYPLQPPAQPQPQPQPQAQPDYLNQPAYNPAYTGPPSAKTGY